MLLTIMIPTYNRSNDIRKNLEMLCDYINRLEAKDQIGILVSDNCSPDDTNEIIEAVCNNNRDICFSLYRNETNVGPAENVIRVIERAETPYGLLLGDDDFISYEYLATVFDILKTGKASCIIPSYYNVDLNGNVTGKGRDLDKKSNTYEAGFKNCLKNSWRAHQMSGLVFDLRDIRNIYHDYLKNRNNLYPQILAVSINCMQYKTIHLTDYPVVVTRPPQSSKAWGYGDNGLIIDMYEVYKVLPGITTIQRSLLEMCLVFTQYWRIAMYLKLGIKAFFKCIYGIQKSNQTTRITAITFPFIVLSSFLFNGVKLLFKGKLFNALQTKVDIRS